MKPIVVAIALSVVFTSCFKKKEVNVEENKFINTCEPNQFWMNDNLIKQVGNEAHSGTYACVVTNLDEYALGLKQPLEKATSKYSLQKVNVSFWVKATTLPLDVSFVYSIDEEKNLFWDSQSIKDMVKESNKWTFIQLEKKLPKIENAKANIGTYVYNPKKNAFMIDDFSISFKTNN
jgi:hypothetical protein